MLDTSPRRDRYSRRVLFGSGFGQALHAQLISYDDARPWRGRAARPAPPVAFGRADTIVPGASPASGTELPDGQGGQALPARSR